MESVLSEEYIPAIENYVLQDLTRSFNSAESLLWHSLTDQDQTLAVGKSANSLLMVRTAGAVYSKLVCFYLYRTAQSDFVRAAPDSWKPARM